MTPMTYDTKPSLQDLVCARLLIAPDEGLLVSRVKNDLKPYLDLAPSELADRIQSTITSLALQGGLERRGRSHVRLTAPGRARALEFLAVSTLPDRLPWGKFKNTFLIARSLELPAPVSPKAQQRIGTASGLRAAILRKRYHLPIDDYPTLIEARDAIAWRELGRETNEAFTLNRVLAWLVSKKLPEPTASPTEALNQLAIASVHARNAKPNELRIATVRNWVRDGAAPQEQAAEMSSAGGVPSTITAPAVDLPEFARRVRDTARTCESGRFGDDKVFISHIWRKLEPEMKRDGIEEFKRRLGEANRLGLLSLSRADLVQAMDPEDVRESETAFLNARFHFVRIS